MPDTSVPADYAKAIQDAADATAQLKTQWQSPAFRQQARQLAESRLEYERTTRALHAINQEEAARARQMDAQRRFGRLGASIYGAGASLAGNPLVRGAWGMAQHGAQYAQGMAQRGLGGTAEAARMGTEMTLLAREFAGVAKPFTDGLEKITRSMRKAMQSMDGDQQKRLLYGVVGVAGAGLAWRYRNTIGAGLSGAAGLAGLTGGGGIGGTALRMAGRLPVIGAALDLGKSMLGWGTENAKKLNPYKETFAEAHPEMAKHLDTLTKDQMREYWQKTQAAGSPYLAVAALSTAGKWGRNAGAWALNQIPIGERIKYIDEYSNHDQLKRELKRRGALGENDGHRGVVLPGGGIEEAGSGYFRMQTAFGQQQLANDQAGGGDGGLLGQIAKWVEQIANKTEVK